MESTQPTTEPAKRRKTDDWWYPTTDRVAILLLSVILVLAVINSINNTGKAEEACRLGEALRVEVNKRTDVFIERGESSAALYRHVARGASPEVSALLIAAARENISQNEKLEDIKPFEICTEVVNGGFTS